MISPGHIGWPCTLLLRGKVNSMTVTGFLPIPMAWMDTSSEMLRVTTTNRSRDLLQTLVETTVYRARNVDMDAIHAKFRSHDTQWNDAQVATFVHSYVKSLTSVRQRSPFFQSEQTCKSFKCWCKESVKCCLK